jgi:leukotriene-A4 hydrolase
MASELEDMRADPATLSNYLSVATTDIHLEWSIDWEQRIIEGSVLHTVKARHDGVEQVIFDSSYINIAAVYAGDDVLRFNVDKPRHPVLGNAVHVHLPKQLNKGETTTIRIEYATTDKCTAIGWLEAHQTATGKYPFL